MLVGVARPGFASPVVGVDPAPIFIFFDNASQRLYGVRNAGRRVYAPHEGEFDEALPGVLIGVCVRRPVRSVDRSGRRQHRRSADPGTPTALLVRNAWGVFQNKTRWQWWRSSRLFKHETRRERRHPSVLERSGRPMVPTVVCCDCARVVLPLARTWERGGLWRGPRPA